jgi:hypothetical protein
MDDWSGVTFQADENFNRTQLVDAALRLLFKRVESVETGLPPLPWFSNVGGECYTKEGVVAHEPTSVSTASSGICR